ncbi:formylglycine-generating enzyme family protein [Thermodesulfobacteriota bacterium]
MKKFFECGKIMTTATGLAVYFLMGSCTSMPSKVEGLRKTPSNMVLIPAGEFEMGSDEGEIDEKPIHTVYLDAFYIDRTEVTVADYRKCVSAGKCIKPKTVSSYTGILCNWGNPDRENHPINGVGWKGAKDYCQFMGKRLPTEAEWEKAATWKDGEKHKFPSGKPTISCEDAVMDDGNKYDGHGSDGCGKGRTWPVGSKSEEINGTFDMAGNVLEWVADYYGRYSKEHQRNPQGPSSGSRRVFRGGGWYNIDSQLRGTIRFNFYPSFRYGFLGFRCACTP